MKQYSEPNDYNQSFVEYQDKQYLPGYYIAGKIHPALKAKTKIGGYAFILLGTGLLSGYLFAVLTNFSLEKITLFGPILMALLFIYIGYKILKK